MKDHMVDVWRPLHGVTITGIEPALFLFRFYHPIEIQRVLKGDPWSFEKHLLILGGIRKGKNVTHIPLHITTF